MNELVNTSSFSAQLALRETERDERKAIAHVTQVEQSRAIMEVQAAMTVAKASPRDELDCYTAMRRTCDRVSFAEKAVYSYRRGGEIVEGPSIKMAEALARCYRNLEHGWREVERMQGKSIVEAFCWDLENNVKSKVTFEVPHSRDTKQGKQPIHSDRDIREHLANYASRQKRGCILSCIPADIIEDALMLCKSSLKKEATVNKIDMAKGLVAAFDELGVTHDMLKRFLGIEKVAGASPAQLVELRQIYQGIKDGNSSVKEFFSKEEHPTLGTQMSQNKKEALLEKLKELGPDMCAKMGENFLERVEMARTLSEVEKFYAVMQEVMLNEKP